ncbi:DNA methyltransferase [Anaeromyxobacter sp. Fw109-5]|uniref:DNA methyltransferase n=1 Tax=Anaeromyxobacter sp. (strain Fw109-5) TaxID=404589 RepID=UPI000312EC15|nr:DNA methyltransferase [Anaeromyxobacter sp. Fw109-5]
MPARSRPARNADFNLFVAEPVYSQPRLPQLSRLEDLSNPADVMQALGAIDWAFTHDETGYLGHDLHPYPAKFIPQIPANLIAALSLPGELVWDPFGGSGTTALEALLLGRQALSTDANPLAGHIARAKCTALGPEQRDVLRALGQRVAALALDRGLEGFLERAWGAAKGFVPDIPNYEQWFTAQATRELAYVRQLASAIADDDARLVSEVALSSIVVAVSNQDSETRYTRRDKGHRPGDVLRLFATALERILVEHEPLERLLGYRRARVATLDLRQLDTSPDAPEPESVDLIVTSPPYANATDYHLYHRFRLFWLGFDPRVLGSAEIGSHLRHQREKRGFDLYADEMLGCLAGIARRLRPGRYCAMVIGGAVFDGKEVDSAARLGEIGTQVGLEWLGAVERKIHATRRSFVPAARRLGAEHIVIFRKPPRSLKVTFELPKYRLWPYEHELRLREVERVVGVAPVSAAEGKLTATLDCYRVDRARRLALTSELTVGAACTGWQTWQARLENGAAARRDPKYVTHGIHDYKGKFYPQLAKTLLNLSVSQPGCRILDPFCGSGTVLLEAQLSGHRAVGFDLNPLAVLISRAKTAVATENALLLDRALRSFLEQLGAPATDTDLEVFPAATREEVLSWFPRPVARRLGKVRRQVEEVPNETAQLLLKVLLSSLIREVSHQEPADLRVRRRKEPLADAPVEMLLRARVVRFRDRCRHFGEQAAAAPNLFPPAHVVSRDSGTEGADLRVGAEAYDAVVTSPPYATALPYIDTDRLSLLSLLDIPSNLRSSLEMQLTGSREIRQRDRAALEAAIDGLDATIGSRTACAIAKKIHRQNSGADVGFRRKNMASLLIRYFTSMWRTLSNLDRAVRPGGAIAIVIGDNVTHTGAGEVTIQSSKAIQEMGDRLGWTLDACVPITVTKEARLNAHHAITRNDILLFRRR